MTTHPKQIGDYTIACELGRGSYSVVYKAFNRVSRRNFAIKIFPFSNLKDPTQIAHFQREVNSMAHMRHDHLVALHDLLWDETNFYLVIDLCPGGDLFDYIIHHDKIDEALAAFLFKQIVEAVGYCHSRGVAHRDLKPENILIDRFPVLKVADFGLCGFVNSTVLMSTFCGSPHYCAPECLAKRDYSGPASDVWSLGIILYSMVTGDKPWKYANLSQMVTEIMAANYTIPDFVSPDCQDLIGRMLRATPEQRLTCEGILEHPWMQRAADAKLELPRAAVRKDVPVLPPFRGMSMEFIASRAKETSERSSHGIYSPFRDTKTDDEDREVSGRLRPRRFPSLPELCVKESALEIGPRSPGALVDARRPGRIVMPQRPVVGMRRLNAICESS
jgi:serine/threonine protein kinase